MNARIQQFLSAENLSQSQFADCLGVARAGVSHIVSGRNKPGFDFIERMARKFPNLNLEWLITGKGKMYTIGPTRKPDYAEYSRKEDMIAENLFSEIEYSQPDLEPETAVTPPALPDQSVQTKTQQNLSDTGAIVPKNRTIIKIIAFYNDGTFQELSAL